MKILLRIIVFGAAIYTAYSLCNSCSAITGLACVDNDKFSICANGIPSTLITQCPVGTVCTASAQICSPPSATVPGSCSRCGTCNANKAFACTGYNTFALCYGTTIPSSMNFTCSGTLVCNVDDPEICIDPAIAGIGGTCPSTTTTTPTTTVSPTITPQTTTPTPSSTINPQNTTTVSPTADPQLYCATLGSSGRFDIPTDTFCKHYVYCTLYNGTWIGNVYECPGSTFFNATSKLCGVETPLRCV
ncbi:protein psiD-like [Episyrphus balteatus]|uniref:protein psiD-like n=1 Tax=Episyrphus balteatus TaxID=286459 RepID=UPI002484F31D|nr:protein psiD-like [Episyrphus balteatus]